MQRVNDGARARPSLCPDRTSGVCAARRHVSEFLREALAGTRRIRPLHPSQDDQARRPFHQCADSRAIASVLEQVGFPVARHPSGCHLGGSFGDRRHVEDLAPSIGPPRARSSRLARLTRCRQQFIPQRTTGYYIQARRDGLGRQLFLRVVMNTRVEAVRQSAQANTPQPDTFACPATATDRGVSVVAVGDGLEWLGGSSRYRSDRDGLVSYYGPTRGSRGSGYVPRSALSFGATGPGSGQDSRSHVLRHSGVGMIPFAWQHRSPSGLEVLHLELELKDLIFGTTGARDIVMGGEGYNLGPRDGNRSH